MILMLFKMHLILILGGIMKKLAVILVTLVFSSTISVAGTGTDALNFLKIKPSARGASIGDGFVAVADDVNAVFYNPAGLTQVNNSEISLMHMLYMAETSYEYGAFAMPAGENLTLGAYIVYLNYGSIDRAGEDSLGIWQAGSGSYTPNDMAIALSAGYKLGDGMSAGLTVKYATESIDTVSLSGIMADLGFLADVEGVKVGATLYNLGSAGSEKAPMGFRVGGSSKFMALTEDDLTAAAGIDYVMASSKISGSLGGEWKYEDFLILRGSFSVLTDAESVNLGVGLKQDLGGMVGEVAYNFSLLGDLGSAHRISVGLKFGDEDNYKGKKKKTTSANAPGKTDNSKSKSTLKYYFKKK